MLDFTPTCQAGLQRLQDFLPYAGGAYANTRNTDKPDKPDHENVSLLSPYLHHRLITEAEVLKAFVDRHGPDPASKFIQEVFWRTYFKGWMERRPSAWLDYRTDRQAAWNRVQTESGLRQEWEAACNGDTGIACFDHWAKELVETGYLHNHARMWLASIWIFTLNLPWALGADFVLRHLIDGDPASNTLSRRWVGGRQTRGKTYLARPDNIATHTNGRFNPTVLTTHAPAPETPPHPDPLPVPIVSALPTDGRIGLVVTSDDLSPDWILDAGLSPVAMTGFAVPQGRSHLTVAQQVTDFIRAALADGLDRMSAKYPVSAPRDSIEDILAWAADSQLDHVVCSYLPVGPDADALAGLKSRLEKCGTSCTFALRRFDTQAWQHSTKGLFAFKETSQSC